MPSRHPLSELRLFLDLATANLISPKVLLYISDAGMVVSLAVFGAYFYSKDQLEMEAPGTFVRIRVTG
jgi:hypothetical protein